MLNWLYQYLFSPLVYIIASPFLLLHPKMRHGVRQRWGRFNKEELAGLHNLPEKRVWFHGASMGDLLALKPTIQAFHQNNPDVGIVITAMTDSGWQYGQRQLAQFGPVFYVPYDLPWAVKRFINHLHPVLLVLEYTELWPVLVSQTKKAGCRLALHNGRISSGTLRYYKWLFKITGNLLQKLDLLMMRDGEEAQRAIRGGALPELTKITGNTKYDNLLPGLAKANSRQLFVISPDTVLLVYGSIHQAEFSGLLQVFAALKSHYPQLALAIAPRYMEHVSLIQNEAAKSGLACTLRSSGAMPGAGNVFIVDTMGELMDLYKSAHIVFVGGSFCKRGGQNILEPAICGKPVLYGPNTDNFKAEVALLNNHGGQQLATFADLQKSIEFLLENPAQITALGALAKETVASISGAAVTNSELLQKLLQK